MLHCATVRDLTSGCERADNERAMDRPKSDGVSESEIFTFFKIVTHLASDVESVPTDLSETARETRFQIATPWPEII